MPRHSNPVPYVRESEEKRLERAALSRANVKFKLQEIGSLIKRGSDGKPFRGLCRVPSDYKPVSGLDRPGLRARYMAARKQLPRRDRFGFPRFRQWLRQEGLGA